MLITLISALALAGVICAARLLQAAVAQAAWPRIEAVVLGAVTNFFDTLGIGKIDIRIATGLALGGIPAVLLAAFVVKTMSVEMLRWLVSVVVLYTAMIMLRAAWVGYRADRIQEGEITVLAAE
jgi:uncharacterized membrane protein YfcA